MIDLGPRDGIREILIRGPNWVGDLVMSTPALRAVRAGFPKARITVQVRPGLDQLLAGNPSIDALVASVPASGSLVALVGEGWRLRRSTRFDLGICLPESTSSALLQRIAGVRRTIGYRREGRGWLLHEAVDPPSEWGPRRMVARERFALHLVQAIGCPDVGTSLELETTEAEEQGRRDLLQQHGVSEEEPQVVLAPGAAYGPSKCWPPESYARVGDALARRGARVLLLGAASEREIAARVETEMRERVANLTGACGLGVAKALIRGARLLVCNDAGARHIAAAFRVPSLVFFGPTSLSKTDLNLDGVEVFENDVDCRPCYARVCPIDHPCLRDIAPERVIDVANEVLERRT